MRRALAERSIRADRRARDARAALRGGARETGQQYDIAAFVRKMERLYDLLHRVSRPTHRQRRPRSDLSFLTGKAPA